MKYVLGFFYALLAFIVLILVANLVNDAVTDLVRLLFPPQIEKALPRIVHPKSNPDAKYKVGDCIMKTYEDEFEVKQYAYKVNAVGKTKYRLFIYAPGAKQFVDYVPMVEDIKDVEGSHSWHQIRCPPEE